MLHPKLCLHPKLRAFLDGKWFAFQSFDGSWSRQVDGDVGAAFDFEREGLDHAAASVASSDGQGSAGGDAQGGFPAGEGWIILV